VPFAFTGKLGKITIDLGESSVSPEAIKLLMEQLAQKRDRLSKLPHDLVPMGNVPRHQCPLLAQSGHPSALSRCLL
jgi:hypothetical protein